MFGGRRTMDETCRLYTDLAWLWPVWGDAADEYAHYGRLRIETDHWTMGLFSLDTWKRVLRETGFEVHEGRYNAAEDEYTVFACVKTG
jgi:hypothetical protein